MSTEKVISHLPGIILSLVITTASWFLADVIHLNSVLLALLLGILIGNITKLPQRITPGLKTSSGFFLEVAIVLMAFGINYGKFMRLGWETILIIIVSMTILLTSTYILAKKLRCPGSTGWLIGFGTAICGSSAIAALAPRVAQDRSDIGISLAVVNLYGLIGMIVLPLVFNDLFTDLQNGVLIGASLHSVGNVAGAGMTVNDLVAETAVTVKLGRVAMLTPALLLFGHFLPKTSEATKRAKLPWYLISFIVISIGVSLISLPEAFSGAAKTLSSFLLATAMAAIGLKVSLRDLATAGKKGLVFGALIFAIQLAVVIGLIMLLKIR